MRFGFGLEVWTLWDQVDLPVSDHHHENVDNATGKEFAYSVLGFAETLYVSRDTTLKTVTVPGNLGQMATCAVLVLLIQIIHGPAVFGLHSFCLHCKHRHRIVTLDAVSYTHLTLPTKRIV